MQGSLDRTRNPQQSGCILFQSLSRLEHYLKRLHQCLSIRPDSGKLDGPFAAAHIDHLETRRHLRWNDRKLGREGFFERVSGRSVQPDHRTSFLEINQGESHRSGPLDDLDFEISAREILAVDLENGPVDKPAGGKLQILHHRGPLQAEGSSPRRSIGTISEL